MRAKWYTAKVIQIQNESPSTKRFWLEIKDIDSLGFIPGQFVVTDLPIGEKRQQRWRSYSIANAPNGTNVIELCIVYLEGGGASKYFWEEVKIGTEIKFKEPSGVFIIPKDLNRTNVFICTGTGVAPFRSMVQHIKNKQLKHGPIHLIFGTRWASGILYKDDFIKWANDQDIKYSVAISRENEKVINNYSKEIDIHSGYVHNVYLDQYKNHPNAHFYICGWSAMIDEAIDNLTSKMGVPIENVHHELYG